MYKRKTHLQRAFLEFYIVFCSKCIPVKTSLSPTVPAPKSRNLGYGMPRPETREGVQDRMISTLSRKPSVVRVPSHTSLCKPVKCDSHTGCSEEFCEILGPGCCSSCIETTNRQIAEEIQHRLFPEIEVNMLAPLSSSSLFSFAIYFSLPSLVATDNSKGC